MTSSPFVTIGMPVYNAEQHIRRALDSLLAQEFKDFELAISDNASTDGSARICAEYAGKDQRVSLQRRDRNYGQLANFDFVAAQARGRYFMWAAADDYWEPGFICAMVKELEAHPEAGLVMCAVKRVTENGLTIDTVRFDGADDPWRLSHLALLMALATGFVNKKRYHLFLYGLFRTELIRSASPYATHQVPHPDRIFMCQFALASRFRYVDRVLYLRTIHDQPGHVRFPEEQFNRLINNKAGWGYAKTVLALGPFLLRSKVVPWRRKIYLPLAMLGMAWAYRGVLYRGQLPTPVRRLLAAGRRTVRLFR